jgi:hypothetical protein
MMTFIRHTNMTRLTNEYVISKEFMNTLLENVKDIMTFEKMNMKTVIADTIQEYKLKCPLTPESSFCSLFYVFFGIFVVIILRTQLKNKKHRCKQCKNIPTYLINNRIGLCGRHVHMFLRTQQKKTLCRNTRTGEHYFEKNGGLVSNMLILARTLN